MQTHSVHSENITNENARGSSHTSTCHQSMAAHACMHATHSRASACVSRAFAAAAATARCPSSARRVYAATSRGPIARTLRATDASSARTLTGAATICGSTEIKSYQMIFTDKAHGGVPRKKPASERTDIPFTAVRGRRNSALPHEQIHACTHRHEPAARAIHAKSSYRPCSRAPVCDTWGTSPPPPPRADHRSSG